MRTLGGGLRFQQTQNSVSFVRKRTILTERPPHVGEVSAKFLPKQGVAWSVQRIPTAVNFGFLDRSTDTKDLLISTQQK
jgi:hypothetical protein